MDFLSSRLQTLFPTAKKFLNENRRLIHFSFATRLGILSAVLFFIWIFAALYVFSQHDQLQSLTDEVSTLVIRAQQLEKQQELYEKMKKQSQISASSYLHQIVEPMSLLQDEKSRVTLLAKRFPDNPSLKERVSFLDSDRNQIRFEEIHHPSSSDVEYHLAHRIQMDTNDLRAFLEALEGARYDPAQGKPFLIIKKFDLLKCYEKGDEKVYSIQAEILKKS